MKLHIQKDRVHGRRSPMIYGHFIEHFHRQIYGGIYDPESPFADEDGFRTDVLEAMRRIKVPILRWPGGCFVSAYHWKEGVGHQRIPMFDKAWRVEDPNTFGTDEFVKLCRKLDCEPYICTNAGTGTAEEMSDWVEYCNLVSEGRYARWRRQNGFPEPHSVTYWSIGNENYGFWELGAKSAAEWGRLVKESAKMIKHVDPTTQLSAAALPDVDWNVNLLKHAGDILDWISIHGYWDRLAQENDLASYEQCMVYTENVTRSVEEVHGLLQAMQLDGSIKIAFDEWNLRGWHHPNVHTSRQGTTAAEYLEPRDKNDENWQYTMADAVFTACFLNGMHRQCHIVGMANFAPVVNTRGCIFTHPDGLVLRSTYHVFELYVQQLGDEVLDHWLQDPPTMIMEDKEGRAAAVQLIDAVATRHSEDGCLAVALVNKHPSDAQTIVLNVDQDADSLVLFTINGASKDAYNDVDRQDVTMRQQELGSYRRGMSVTLEPHSVNVLRWQ